MMLEDTSLLAEPIGPSFQAEQECFLYLGNALTTCASAVYTTMAVQRRGCDHAPATLYSVLMQFECLGI
jgi:hypothetical protein